MYALSRRANAYATEDYMATTVDCAPDTDFKKEILSKTNKVSCQKIQTNELMSLEHCITGTQENCIDFFLINKKSAKKKALT